MGSDVEEEQVSSMVPPLAYLCKTVLMTNHAALTAEKLEIVPSDIAQELFRDLRKTRSISSSKDLANFRNSLTKVCLAEVGHLPGPFMPELSTWEHLESLNLSTYNYSSSATLALLPKLSNLVNLQLNLLGVDPEPIASLVRLTKLVVYNGGTQFPFKNVTKLESLATLRLISTQWSWEAIEHCKSIHTLQIDGPSNNADNFPDFAKMPNLKVLTLSNCTPAVFVLSALEQCSLDLLFVVSPSINNKVTATELKLLSQKKIKCVYYMGENDIRRYEEGVITKFVEEFHIPEILHSTRAMAIVAQRGLEKPDAYVLIGLKVFKYHYKEASLCQEWLNIISGDMTLQLFSKLVLGRYMFLPGMIATFIGQTWRRYPQTTLCTSVASMIKRLTKDDSTLALTALSSMFFRQGAAAQFELLSQGDAWKNVDFSICEAVGTAASLLAKICAVEQWNAKDTLRFMTNTLRFSKPGTNGETPDSVRWTTWGMVIAANTASSAAILAEPATFDKIWNYFKEVNSTDNINIFPLIQAISQHKVAVDKIAANVPDFVKVIKKKVKVMKGEMMPQRCLAHTLDNAFTHNDEWREYGYSKPSIWNMAIDKCLSLDFENGPAFADVLRGLAKTDEGKQRCLDAGILDLVINKINSAKDIDPLCNLVASLLSLVGTYTPSRAKLSTTISTDYIRIILDGIDNPNLTAKAAENYCQALYAISHPIINLATNETESEYMHIVDKHQRAFMKLGGFSVIMKVVERNYSSYATENILCALEAWLWQNDDAKTEFAKLGGLSTVVMSNLNPKNVIVTSSAKSMCTESKGELKRAVESHLARAGIVDDLIKAVKDKSRYKSGLDRVEYAIQMLQSFASAGRRTAYRMRNLGVVGVLTEMLFTSLKRLQKKPKWAAIAHACGGALGAMIVRDFFPASGALCTICLKDMSHKTKFSGCATCLSFICSKCQDDMYHLHPHDVLYKEFSSTFTADLLLSDGTIKKVVDTLAENGAAVYPVNVTETLVRLLCNTATVHKSRALKLINAVPNILDVVKVIAKAEETRGGSVMMQLCEALTEHSTTCESIINEDSLYSSLIENAIKSTSDDHREYCGFVLAALAKRRDCSVFFETLGRKVQEGEGDTKKKPEAGAAASILYHTMNTGGLEVRPQVQKKLYEMALLDVVVPYLLDSEPKYRKPLCNLLGQLMHPDSRKKYYKTLVAHIHQQIHVINEAIAKQREAEVDLPKYKTSTEKKEAEEAREKPVKEAVTSLMCIIDAIKHSVEANALMDDHFGKRDVYAAVAEAALIEDVIKHSSFSIFNLMAVTSGHNRFNLAREWVKAGNVPVLLKLLRACDIPNPNQQLVEYVFISVIVWAKHEEALFVKTVKDNPDVIPTLFKLCLSLRLTYGLPGAAVWSALRAPEITFNHIISLQDKIIKLLNSSGYYKEVMAGCRALEAIEHVGDRPASSLSKVLENVMAGLAKAEKQELKKSLSGAGLAIIKDKPSLVIDLCSEENLGILFDRTMDARGEPQSYVSSLIIEVAIFHGAQVKKAPHFCMRQCPKLLQVLLKALKHKWTSTSMRGPGLMIAYLITLFMLKCKYCFQAVRPGVLQFLPSLLVTTDVGVKEPTHHFAYGMLLLAGLTYTHTTDEAMAAFSRIASSPVFKRKFGKLDAPELITTLIKRLFEDIKVEVTKEPDVSVVLACMASILTVPKFTALMNEEQVDTCINMLAMRYSEAPAETIKVLQAVVCHHKKLAPRLVTEEVAGHVIKLFDHNWNSDFVTARSVMFLFTIGTMSPAIHQFIQRHEKLIDSGRKYRESPSISVKLTGTILLIAYGPFDSLPKIKHVMKAIQEPATSEYTIWISLALLICRAIVLRYPVDEIPWRDICEIIAVTWKKEPYSCQLAVHLITDMLKRNAPKKEIGAALDIAARELRHVSCFDQLLLTPEVEQLISGAS